MSRAVFAYRALFWPSLAVLGSWLLCGCGGKAHSSDLGPGSSMGQGGSVGSGGVAAQAGTAGGESEAEPVLLDDVFPWFDGSGDGGPTSGPSDAILHIAASGTPARATLSTHNHTALLSGFSAIGFSARASVPLRLLVSASNTIQAYDYFAARDAGTQWPVASVEVGVDWRDFLVPLADMKPPEVGDSDGMPSFFLAFIVEAPAPIEVWLDDVRFER